MESATKLSIQKTCANCSAPLDAKFCTHCGQKHRSERDLSLRHFFLHTLHSFTNLDAKIFRSLKALLFSPGKLTSEWVDGRERPYMAPLQLFLVINVFYFIFVDFIPISTLTNPLYVQENYQVFSPLIKPIIKEKIKSSGMDSVQFEKSYNETSSSQAKTLVIIMAPVFAILTSMLYFYKRRYFVEHLVFSIHFYAFFMIVESMVVTLTGLIAVLVVNIFAIPPKSVDWDAVITFFPGITILVYLFISLRRVFGGWWWTTALKSLVLTYAILCIIFLYRFILFFTTIYTMNTGK